MAHPARPVGQTPTYWNLATGSGAQTPAAPSATRPSDGDFRSLTFSRQPLEPGQIAIEDLRERSLNYPSREPVSAVEFVTSEIRVPRNPRPNQISSNYLQNGKIGYWPLLLMAEEWDADGTTTLSEFLDSVECFTSGTEKNKVVQETLIDLTNDVFAARAREEEEVVNDGWLDEDKF